MSKLEIGDIVKFSEEIKDRFDPNVVYYVKKIDNDGKVKLVEDNRVEVPFFIDSKYLTKWELIKYFVGDTVEITPAGWRDYQRNHQEPDENIKLCTKKVTAIGNDGNLYQLNKPELYWFNSEHIKPAIAKRSEEKPYEIISVWAYYGDSGEGGGRSPLLGYCSSFNLAARAAKGKGFWGGDGAVSVCKALKIGSEIFALIDEKPIDLNGTKVAQDAKLREQTLASLTVEQKRVLGIK